MKKRIYLYKSGNLKRQDNSLVFLTKNEKIYIPIMQIEIIFVFGSCEFNKEVFNLLSKYNISVYMFNYYGNYFGSFIPNNKTCGNELIKQYEAYINDDIKKKIVQHNILNSSLNVLSLLKYYNKKGCNIYEQINEIELLIKQIKNDEVELLITEAKIKKIYYSCFNNIIKNKKFIFNGRSTQPPKDEINTLMSFGYAMLYSIVENTIYIAGMIPSVSYVHGISKNANKLQYDIADILKPVIIDRLVFRLINKNQINLDMFDYKDEGVYLNKAGASTFITEFEMLLNKTIKFGGKSLSYRSIINREVYVLKQYIVNNKKMKSFIMEW